MTSKTPDYTYIDTLESADIIENFFYPSQIEAVFKIVGLRGSGKTVILSRIQKEFSNQNSNEDWLVYNLNPSRDISGFPVYFVCTGLFENVLELGNAKNLTFFRRGKTVETKPLNYIRMVEMYKSKLDIDPDTAKKLATITKGYAYAFQTLGSLYFNKGKNTPLDELVNSMKAELFSYSYEKIWEELSYEERFLVSYNKFNHPDVYILEYLKQNILI